MDGNKQEKPVRSSEQLAIGERIKKFRKVLGWSQKEMAAEIRTLTRDGATGSRVSEWENGGWDQGSLAKVALLHRDPVACLEWLWEGHDMPRIHVDLDDSLPNGARTLYEIGSAAAAISEASRQLANGATQAASEVMRRVIRPRDIPDA